MPRGLNKVLLIGNLGRDPEMRYTPDGTPVTTFSIASSRVWVTTTGDRHEVTEWFHIVAWRRLAEICHQHLAQGSRVYVEGRLQTRSWDDADGQHHQRVEIVANEMIVLDGGPRPAHGTHPRGAELPTPTSADDTATAEVRVTDYVDGRGELTEPNDVPSSDAVPVRAQPMEEHDDV